MSNRETGSSSDAPLPPGQLADRLLAWYDRHARALPWRVKAVDPYAVWVSEIMLQQTRVETVIPYYQRWMRRFPTVAALASAALEDVLAAWEGLGYYSRARNLHHAAKIIIAEHGGRLPADPRKLRSLPGIGRYTAGAIASIAFGLDEPALDGNIRRILARVFNVTLDARSPTGERLLWHLAGQNLPPGRAGDYNQALMDLGSAVCVPRNPLCLICPLMELCQARALGVQEQRPVLEKRPEPPHHLVTAAIIERDGQILIAQRPVDGLLGGMWEFPGGKLDQGETLEDCLRREIREELGVNVRVGQEFGVYQHGYTHFRVTLHAFRCRLEDHQEPRPIHPSALAWTTPQQLKDYPMGKIDRSISRDLVRGGSGS